MHGIKKRHVFLFSAPQVSAWGLCFRSVDLFPPGWNGGFHLWRYSGGPLGRLLRPVVSPRFKCPGCRFTWSPGLLGSFSWSYCLRHVQVVAATAAPPVLHTLCQPGFPRKLRLRGCRRWLRLRLLSGRSPLLGIQLGLVAFYPSG